MADWNKVKIQMQNLIVSANTATGKTNSNLTDCINALVSGYGQGSGGSGSGGAESANYVNQLYEFYGVDKAEYPYLVLQDLWSYNWTPQYGISIYFAKTVSSLTLGNVLTGSYWADIDPISDFTDIDFIVKTFKENITPSSLTEITSQALNDIHRSSAKYEYWTNFDCQFTNAPHYRFDESENGSSSGAETVNYADQLYEYYGVDKKVYPYVMYYYFGNSNALTFAKTLDVANKRLIDLYCNSTVINGQYTGSTVEELVAHIMNTISISSLRATPNDTFNLNNYNVNQSSSVLADNFDFEYTSYGTLYDLAGTQETLPFDGLSNGYDVMFYDENGEELAFYSVKQGHTIEKPPKYACSVWKTSDGATVTFPYVPTSDISLYANNDTLADQLYEFYGVDKSAYPYVMVQVINKTTNASYPYTYKIAFFDTITTSINQPRLVGVNSNITQSTHDYYISELANIEGVVLAIKERIANISSSYSADIVDDNSTTMIYTHYTNFDYSFNYSTHYRLDEVAETLPYDGLANGYDVMFYDENNMGLAFYSIRQGNQINPPIYQCKEWQDANGNTVVFPFTPTSDIIIYALNNTYAKLLYDHYDVDASIYPYVQICVTGTASYQTTLSIRFAKSVSGSVLTDNLMGYVTIYQSTSQTLTSAELCYEEVIKRIPKGSLTSEEKVDIGDWQNRVFCTNYNFTVTQGTLYRLDQ